MPNVMNYGNVSWPDGDRMATSGEYSGQHKGTPLQDATSEADNNAYVRERNTVRYGTLMPDDADNNFPDLLIDVTYTATGDVTEISLEGVSYDATGERFVNVPSKTESFTFKDGETTKTATNTSGMWEVS